MHVHSFDVKAGDSVVLRCGVPADETQGTEACSPTKSGSSVVLPLSYAGLTTMASPGDAIVLGRYLATGAEETSVYLTVAAVDGDAISCVASNAASLGGLLTVFHTERSEDGLANMQNDLPVLCPEDKQMISALASEFEIDFVSLSFTRSGDDVASARDFLDAVPAGACSTTKILAKLETRQSLFNFAEIASTADGVILSRGNLGLDVLPEKMALCQKAVALACNRLGKPALMTRVVDTMVSAPRPTRAEATDVANAVLDGVDGILLGAETLRGKHPVASVSTVLAICRQAEAVFDHSRHFEQLMSEALDAEEGYVGGAGGGSHEALLALHRSGSSGSLTGGDGQQPSLASAVSRMSLGSTHALNRLASAGNVANGTGGGANGGSTGAVPSSLAPSAGAPYLSKLESVASSAVRAAQKVNAKLIVVYTQSGHAAALVAKYRPPVPIMTLVIPRLTSDGMSWTLEGRGVARQALAVRGLLPVLAAPAPSGEALLEEAVMLASSLSLVGPGDHVVVVHMMRSAYAIKIVTLDDSGASIANIRPRSLLELMKAAAGGEADVDMTADGLGRATTPGVSDGGSGASHPHLAYAGTGVPRMRGELVGSMTMARE